MKFNSIRFRIFAVILGGVAAGGLLFEFVWLPRMNQLVIEAQSREVRREAQILADGVLPFLLSNQIGAVYETLDSVQSRYQNWNGVILNNADGRRIYPLGTPTIADSNDLVTEVVPIQFRGQDLGSLSVLVDLGPEVQRFRNEQRRMVTMGATIVALTLLLVGFIVDRLFTRRLIQVADAADALAVGNYDVSLPSGTDEVGQLARSFGVMREQIQDHTGNLKVARERAEQALEARSSFLAAMSHEIRTPLNGVIPVAELLAEGDLHPEQYQKVQTIINSGKALSSIVDDILDTSMLESGRVTIKQQEFSPYALCNEALEVVRPVAESKGLELINKSSIRKGLTCLGDADRLRQVLINILGNAVKFTDTGSVTLGAFVIEENGRFAKANFRISDTGIGIPKEAQSRIFNRFEQADGSTVRRFGGTGLGLTIVNNLVTAMGGRISVASEQGNGSAFTIELELKIVETAKKAQPKAKTNEAGIGVGRTALIVDDNEINRKVASVMLTRLGFEIDSANDGVDAVSKAGARKYDLILMDVHMYEMDGLAATRKIRSGGGLNAKTAIVALTASVQESEIQECHKAGMDSFVAKPIGINKLQSVVSTVLQESTG